MVNYIPNDRQMNSFVYIKCQNRLYFLLCNPYPCTSDVLNSDVYVEVAGWTMDREIRV